MIEKKQVAKEVDLTVCRQVLKNAQKSEHGACAGLFLNKWAPRLLKEIEELREYKAMYEGLCR